MDEPLVYYLNWGRQTQPFEVRIGQGPPGVLRQFLQLLRLDELNKYLASAQSKRALHSAAAAGAGSVRKNAMVLQT